MSFRKTARLPVLLAVFCFLATALFAQASLETMVTAYPNNPEVLNSYGIELAGRGDLMGAISVWRRALDFDRNNVHLYNNIGSALKRLGHDEHAYAWYAAALQIKPVYWTYYNLAILYRDRGQTEEARWALDQSLRLNPQFTQAIDMRERIATTTQVASAKRQEVKIPEAFPASALISRHEVGKPAASSSRNHVDVALNGFAKPQMAAVQKTARPGAVPIATDAGGQVFLTFDGGSTDAGFASIVDSLRRYSVRCTFFLTGKFAEKYPEKCRFLLADGHEIANHSMSHPNMKSFSKDKIAAELEAAEQAFVNSSLPEGFFIT